MFNLVKRSMFTFIFAFALMLALPLTVSAQAAIRSFSMDRTTVQPGQSISLTVQTNLETTHVFAEIGGVRVQGTQAFVTSTARTWSIAVHPAAGVNQVIVYANTANSIVGAISIAIPITVGAADTVQPTPPPHHHGHGSLDIISITEIPALAANQVRLEVITGTGVTHTWARVETAAGRRHPDGVLQSTTATTRTWHITFTPNPRNQTVRIGANNSRAWPGGNANVSGPGNQLYTLQHTAPFVPPANPIILPGTLRANPVQVVQGGTTTITLTTNADVNHVWVTVDGVRVNARRTNPNAATTAARTWSIDNIRPTATGNITVYANATDTPTGAFTQNVWVEALLTPVQITHASATWYPTTQTATNATQVRVIVHTNLHATHMWLNVAGGTNLYFDRDANSTVAGNTRVWTMTVARGTQFTSTSPIQVSANNQGDWITGMGTWIPFVATIPGVGQAWVPGAQQQGQQNQGIAWDHAFEPNIISTVPWPVTLTFTTSNDVTEVRLRDAAWNLVGTATTTFTAGENDTRLWTLSNLFPQVPSGVTSMSFFVQVRRGGTAWTDTQTVTVPVL